MTQEALEALDTLCTVGGALIEFSDEIQTIRKALEEDKWQDISTAPSEKYLTVGYYPSKSPKKGAEMYYPDGAIYRHCIFISDRNDWWCGKIGEFLIESGYGEPDVWMPNIPLPTPPKGEDDEV